MWKSSWLLAREMFITVAVGKARSLVRSKEPSSHASVAVKWGNVRELSWALIVAGSRGGSGRTGG